MSVQLDHWYQWKERCAIGRCDELAAFELSRLIRNLCRKKRYLARYPEMLDVEDAPTFFDSYCSRPIQGKDRLHKEWMTESIDLPEEDELFKLRLCAKRAGGVLKNALEHFLRGENNFRNSRKALYTNSLDGSIVTEGGTEIKAYDPLLQKSAEFLGKRNDEMIVAGSQPETAAADREYDEIARACAEEMFEVLDKRSLQIALVLALQLPLTAESLHIALDVTQGTLYEWRKRYSEQLMEKMSKKFPEDNRQQHFFLSGRLMNKLHEYLIQLDPAPEWALPILAVATSLEGDL